MPDDLDKFADQLAALFEGLDDEAFELKSAHKHEPIKHLWHSGDPDWLAQREQEWRRLVNNGHITDGCRAQEVKAMEAFFLRGDEPPLEARLSTTTSMLLTPFITASEAREVYALHTHTKQSIQGGFMAWACTSAQGLPWLRPKIQAFLEGVLGNCYRYQEELNGKRMQVASPNPSAICEDYARSAINFMTGEQQYDYAVDALPYFLSALPHYDEERRKKRSRIGKMLEKAAEILEDSGDKPDLVVEFAQALKGAEGAIFRNWRPDTQRKRN